MTTLAAIDGEILLPEQAKVSIFDRGFLYGDSVFETIRTYSGLPYALSEHLERLATSAERVGIELPISLGQFAEEVRLVVQRAANPESYIRLMVTRGSGELGLLPGLAVPPLRLVLVTELTPPSAEIYASGIAVICHHTRRATDSTLAEGAKVGNYLASVLALREAAERGAAEALIVDGDGKVVEGASSNVFFVRAGVLTTPPESAGILPGITRAGLLSAAQELGIEVHFQAPSVEELQSADEVFISSSIREVLAVVEVDSVSIGSGRPGPLTQRLLARFRRNVREKLGLV